jgi:hypothetical protein
MPKKCQFHFYFSVPWPHSNFFTLCAESLCNSGHLVTLRWKFLVQRSGKTADIFDQKCTRQSWSPLALFRPNFFSKKNFKFFFSAKISQFRYLIAFRYAQTRSFAIKLHVREYLNASSRAKVREYPFKSRISHQLARWRQCFYVFFNTLGHLN